MAPAGAARAGDATPRATRRARPRVSPSSHRQAWEIAIFEVEQHGNCPHGADEPAPTEPCVYWAGHVSNGTEGFEVVGPGQVARPCQLFVDSVLDDIERDIERNAECAAARLRQPGFGTGCERRQDEDCRYNCRLIFDWDCRCPWQCCHDRDCLYRTQCDSVH